MRRHSLPVGVFTIACSLLAGAATAQAAVETWVSGTGANTGTCPITAPCRTFVYAFTQTASGGAINVLSSGNFGPLTITNSLSIVASGVEAVITSGAGGAAIIVQAASGAIVSLRGLTVDLRGTANVGISFLSGAALHVQDCVIRSASTGIRFAPASGTPEFYVADSVIADTQSIGSGAGIDVRPTGSGGAKVLLERVRVENGNYDGIDFFGYSTTGSITGTVRDSISAGNNNQGISVADDGNGTTNVMIDRTASVNNSGLGIGIFVTGPGATVEIGNSTVSGNAKGLHPQISGVIRSYGTTKWPAMTTMARPPASSP